MARQYVIAFAGIKGGVGKSTLAIAIACEWARRGLRVLVVDTDVQQQSVHTWNQIREELGVTEGPDVDSMSADDLRDKWTTRVSRSYDVVIIDTAGKLGEEPTAAIGRAQLVLMPCGPNGIEVAAMAHTFEEVSAIRKARKFDAAVLITRRIAGTTSGRTAHRSFEDVPFPPLETELDMREDYAKSWDAGLGPTTWAPYSDAANEVKKLTREVEKRIKMDLPPDKAAPLLSVRRRIAQVLRRGDRKGALRVVK